MPRAHTHTQPLPPFCGRSAGALLEAEELLRRALEASAAADHVTIEACTAVALIQVGGDVGRRSCAFVCVCARASVCLYLRLCLYMNLCVCNTVSLVQVGAVCVPACLFACVYIRARVCV